MIKKIIIFIFCILMVNPVWGKNLGNKIDNTEFPKSDNIGPFYKNNDIIISGSVEKDIEMNLNNCIRIALGNNPEINSAFQDILASDARINQVWANFSPTFSWQTSYTRIRQLQLSDALGTNLQFNYYLLGQISLQ